jgi:2-alkenal reductase
VTDRLSRVLLSGVLILLVAIFIQPYLNSALFSARSPRPIEARGSLSESERTTIAIFKSVSPSVVQVVGRTQAEQQVSPEGDQIAGVQTGTGFMWDAAGHVVTNNHVVLAAPIPRRPLPPVC